MTLETYILHGKTPVRCENPLEWSMWFQKADRVVRQTQTQEVVVSTVFTGIDHSYELNSIPLLFETVIFGGEHDGETWHYHSWEGAEEGHKAACIVAGIGGQGDE